MTGIYLLKNKVTGNIYIGQSINIERRFAEHKTPNAYGNDRLHGDIQKYGVDNFIFEVIEECGKEMLRDKELHYIHTLNPYYNTIGKKRTEETKKNVSKGVSKWWNNLPNETKERIIKNNLTGQPKGHKVSKETREKISRKISEIQKQKVRCVETGEIFNSVGEFEESVGACTGTCAAYWRGKIKSVKGFHVEKV